MWEKRRFILSTETYQTCLRFLSVCSESHRNVIKCALLPKLDWIYLVYFLPFLRETSFVIYVCLPLLQRPSEKNLFLRAFFSFWSRPLFRREAKLSPPESASIPFMKPWILRYPQSTLTSEFIFWVGRFLSAEIALKKTNTESE